MKPRFTPTRFLHEPGYVEWVVPDPELILINDGIRERVYGLKCLPIRSLARGDEIGSDLLSPSAEGWYAVGIHLGVAEVHYRDRRIRPRLQGAMVGDLRGTLLQPGRSRRLTSRHGAMGGRRGTGRDREEQGSKHCAETSEETTPTRC